MKKNGKLGDTIKYDKKNNENQLSFGMKRIVMSNIFSGQISHCGCNHKCLPKKISDYAGMYYSTVGQTLKKVQRARFYSIFQSMSQKIFSKSEKSHTIYNNITHCVPTQVRC